MLLKKRILPLALSVIMAVSGLTAVAAVQRKTAHQGMRQP